MTATLIIHSPGLCTTVQDAGRLGHQARGVPVSGALDVIALAVANALVGNAPDSAALEICYSGPSIEVDGGNARIALVGEGAALRLGDGTIIPANRSLLVRSGEKVTVAGPHKSATAILAVEGGIQVPDVLGSRSTFLRGAFGGFEGRVLAAGDLLSIKAADETRRDLEVSSTLPYGEGPIRVVLGPQADYFDDANIARFQAIAYEVGRDSDRMGMRLTGEAIEHAGGYDIVSDGIVNGSIQIPGNGKPLILLSDRQTIGGYPKIATVISSDLPRLGRKRAGDTIRFEAVTVEQAVAIRREQAGRLQAVLRSLRSVGHPGIADERLLMTENLISGVACWSD
jgi:allophanate hydrolase